MADVLLEVDRLAKRFPGSSAPILDGVSFRLAAGETVSVVGRSGAGKSTLLSLLAGLSLPDAGEVRLEGTSLGALEETGRARLRARRIGVVLQSDNLIAFLTAAENVELAVTLAGGSDPPARAQELLGELGLAHRAGERPAGSPAVRPSASPWPSRWPTSQRSCSPTS